MPAKQTDTGYDLWQSRKRAEAWLADSLASEDRWLRHSFQLTEYLAQELGAQGEENGLARSSALVVAKARFLGQASYSMALEGLGQESGAVLRVWLEALELLKYLKDVEGAVSQFWSSKLPSAGKRAKKIDGGLQELRDQWNVHASHIGPLNGDAWTHLVRTGWSGIRSSPSASEHVLRENVFWVSLMCRWTNFAGAENLRASAPKRFSTSKMRMLERSHDEWFELFGTRPNNKLQQTGGEPPAAE